MRLPITAAEIAPRIATGAFILNSGLGKRGADETTAAGIHGFATGTYPFLSKVPPTTFATALSTTEIVIGAALLTPFVPTVVAGAALTGFSASLLGLYLRTPGMRKDGSIFPTQEGLTLFKDIWMTGIGVGLVVEGLTGRAPKTAGRTPRKADRRTGRTDRRAVAKASGKAAHQSSKKAAKQAARANAAALRTAARTGAVAGAAVTRVRDTVSV